MVPTREARPNVAQGEEPVCPKLLRMAKLVQEQSCIPLNARGDPDRPAKGNPGHGASPQTPPANPRGQPSAPQTNAAQLWVFIQERLRNLGGASHESGLQNGPNSHLSSSARRVI